jgi:hypothetical protein
MPRIMAEDKDKNCSSQRRGIGWENVSAKNKIESELDFKN